jgi:hypothetical protein
MSLHSRLRFLRQSCAARPVSRCRNRRLRLERLDDRTVPSNFAAANVPELIADINAANVSASADTITLVAGSRFTLTSVNNTTHGPTGLPVIAVGENLTIVGNGDVIERSTAAGVPEFRLFDVAAGATLNIQNATLQGGVAVGDGRSALDGGSSSGGAIFNQGVLSLNGVTVQNNTALGSASVSTWVFIPATNGLGGGLFSSGSLNLTGCTVQNNRAEGGGGQGAAAGQGGGLYVTGSLTVNDCVIQKNLAAGGRGGDGTAFGGLVIGPPFGYPGAPGGNAAGGGLYFGGGTATIGNCTMISNTAQGGAGGNGYYAGSAGGNGGNASGGGLFVSSGSVTLHGVRVSSNQAVMGAGGRGTHGLADGTAGHSLWTPSL